jgi:DNA adenine methylase
MNENVSAWLSAVEGLPECHERLRRVEIRNMDGVDFIKAYDHPRALFYLDPPYMHGTRKTTGEYAHEMSDGDHAKLLDTLAGIKGRFMLSGYHSTLYDRSANIYRWCEWEIPRPNSASSAKEKEIKTEVIWTNYSTLVTGEQKCAA